MTRCKHHPKYSGATEIKRIKTCDGCKAVREEHLRRVWHNKKYGRGSYPSITTPNYKCSLSHLFAEIGIASAYGLQSPWFWRDKNTPIPIKNKFYELKKVLGMYLKDELHNKIVKGLVNRAVALSMNGVVTSQMQREHDDQMAQQESEEAVESTNEEIKTELFQTGSKGRKLSISDLKE